MARTSGDMEREARRRADLRPDPSALDGDEGKSGAAVSDPDQPRGDFDRRFSGSARYDEQPDAVPQTAPQATGGVRPKTSGRQYETR